MLPVMFMIQTQVVFCSCKNFSLQTCDRRSLQLDRIIKAKYYALITHRLKRKAFASFLCVVWKKQLVLLQNVHGVSKFVSCL